MEAIHVTAAISDYDVLIGHQIIDKLPELLAGFDPGGELVVVTDDGVDACYPELPTLPRTARRVILKHGEQLKSLAQAEALTRRLAEWNVSRTGIVIALGGGVIGDLAGFVASIYLRGIPWIAIPTTLLAQVDSAIGGKVAVNLPYGKNLVGAFYPPRLVICDTSFLAELTEPELANGLGEVVKTAIIGDPHLFELLETRLDAVLARDQEVLQTVVTSCVKVKAEVVSKDERDRGDRAVLNLGHTIAHAIEAAQGFGNIPHGTAVLMGILAVLPLSEELCDLPHEQSQRIRSLIRRLPMQFQTSLPPFEAIESYVAHDKKVRRHETQWVLLKGIGMPVTGINVPRDRVWSAYQSILEYQ